MKKFTKHKTKSCNNNEQTSPTVLSPRSTPPPRPPPPNPMPVLPQELPPPSPPAIRTVLELGPVKNLVFQGGSVKGTAYGGAVGGLHAAFAKNGMNFDAQIENVAGTSAGAITALALSLGTGVAELVDTIGNTDFKSFLDTKAYEIVSNISNDSSSLPAKTSAAMNTLPLLNSSFGLASGQNILDYLEAFVKLKTDINFLTFGELHTLVEEDRKLMKEGLRRSNLRKDLYVVAYNLTLDTPLVFNYKDTPDSVISDAVRCSMSIPYVFIPHKNFVKKDVDGDLVRIEASEDLWIDGGITDNYPIWVFDKLLKAPYAATVGFYLVSSEEKREIEQRGPIPSHSPDRREIKNILDYTKAVIETVISSQQTSAHKQGKDIERTVYIDHLGTNMMNFGMTIEEKNNLVRSGWDCACDRFGLGNEYVGQCKLEIKIKEEVVEKKKRKKGEMKLPEGGNGDGESKETVESSGTPSPDLDAGTDTAPMQKCVIV